MFFFFLLSRPPPRPTLFPYTTLFRSREQQLALRVGRLELRGVDPHVGPQGGVVAEHMLADRQLRPLVGQRDRKSTRLNSSHANISYAVFCLKKKNRINPDCDLRSSLR